MTIAERRLRSNRHLMPATSATAAEMPLSAHKPSALRGWMATWTSGLVQLETTPGGQKCSVEVIVVQTITPATKSPTAIIPAVIATRRAVHG
jgi:hypothetical protein